MNGEAWGIWDAAALVAGVDAELAESTSADAELVKKGRLNQKEADYRRALIADIREDLAAAFAPIGQGEPCGHAPREGRAVAWANKVRWINGELDARRADYPKLVAKGRLTQADADRQLRTLEILRRLYWEKLFMWEPPAGPARDYLAALRAAALSGAGEPARQDLFNSEGARIYRDIVRKHLAAVELEQNGQGRLVA